MEVWGCSICHVTVLPGQSQQNQPNPLAAHLYSAEGVTGFFDLSLSQLWAVGDAAGWQPANQNLKYLYTPMMSKQAK